MEDCKIFIKDLVLDDPVMEDYKGYGFIGRLPKPVDIEDLEKTIKTLC